MLLVKTKIGISKIHGIGVFAAEFIPKNTIVWKYVSGFDLRFSKEQIEKFPAETQNFLNKYTYLSKDTGFYVLCSDDARFYNHSKNPTTAGIDLEDTDDEGGDGCGKGYI